MKNTKFITLSIAVLFFSISQLSAQLGTDACSTYSTVASSCVGECGNPGQLEYQSGVCAELLEDFCVTNTSSSLCINNRAVAFIWVDGVLVDRGDITSVGSSISFSAPCNSNIKVIVHAHRVIKGLECVWLGNLYFSLKKE